MKKTGKLVGVCNCICHCGLKECFTNHDEDCKCDAHKEYCASSERIDGKKHSWKWDGDDPWILCVYCGERRRQ